MTKKALSEIPLEEVIQDLCENERDIGVCKHALSTGRTHYRDGEPIEKWMTIGEGISETIKKELTDRYARLSNSLQGIHLAG